MTFAAHASLNELVNCIEMCNKDNGRKKICRFRIIRELRNFCSIKKLNRRQGAELRVFDVNEEMCITILVTRVVI